MSNSEKPINKTWQTVFSVGQITIFLAGIIFLEELSMESQPLLATVASLAWFTSSFLYSKIPDKIGESKRMPSRSFWMGIAEIVLAVSLLTVIDPKTKLAFWGKMFNMIFGAGGFAAFYSAVFFFRSP